MAAAASLAAANWATCSRDMDEIGAAQRTGFHYPFGMNPIVIATGIPHKVEEMRAIFATRGIPVIGLKDLGGSFTEPTESGTTFEANATIKALSYAGQTGRICLADDSGLEVDALSGAPGVISSHYSTNGRETGLNRVDRDRANNQKLLKQLATVPDGKRSARFVCVMCLAGPQGVLALCRGTFEGRIGMPGEVPRGHNGFGYDPLFLLPLPDARSSAELSSEEKNHLSHRGAAAAKMAQEILALL
jgi:XTP/dITP diphosphohydrolase